MSLPNFNSHLFMDEISKRKLTSEQVYMLALRQILLNQVSLMTAEQSLGGDNLYTNASDSKKMARRIEEYLQNKE